MKKRLFVLIICVFVTTAGGCTNESTKVQTKKLAFVCDLKGVNDKGLNQQVLKGIETACDSREVKYSSYEMDESTENDCEEKIKKAVTDGANIVVCAGKSAQKPVGLMQENYPETNFILVDAIPVDGQGAESVGSNTISIKFDELQRGFLAGYAAVSEGYCNLGFLVGADTDEAKKCGSGFAQGAKLAAAEKNLDAGELIVNYKETGSSGFSPQNTSAARKWFKDGCQVVMGSDQQVNLSVIQAAEENEEGGFVIGSEVEQSQISKRILVSAVKNVKKAVRLCLTKFLDGKQKTGTKLIYDAKDEGVRLNYSTWNLKKLVEEDYHKLCDRLSSSQISLSENDLSTSENLKDSEYINLKMEDSTEE